MIKFTLVFQSLLNRWLSCLLIILTLAFSISLYFTVSRIQESVKASFKSTVSGVDSVVAARGGNLQILLNSVFLIGEPSAPIQWNTYKDIANNNKIKWAVPISLGDSHKGYRVIGTTNDYFKQIKYSSGKNIEFIKGNTFNDVFDVILGSVVAGKLNYNIGEEIAITHGLSDVGEVHTFTSVKNENHDDHDDHAKHEEDEGDDDHASHDHENLGFKVSGILKPTGTPIDNAVYVSLAGIEAMHTGWIGNQKVIDVSLEQIMKNELKPKTISAIFLSLNNRTQIFQFQRDIINYKEEAISSVMPGITLSRLWMLTGNVDKAFKIITFFIIIIALLGMIAMTIAGLSSRRREMAILRSVGASPTNIVSLLLVESIIISVVSCIVGYILMVVIFSLGKDYLQNNYGIFIDSFSIKNYDLQIVITIVFAALIATIVPAIQIYKNTLRDGLSVKS
ncbi:MAG: FtsX-like permease family protein [Pelagibacterales bacterium]|jgi:putative ABC transport system permease protein|nr:FtsX-like permease family protein [Pelagibacterales bacterium]